MHPPAVGRTTLPLVDWLSGFLTHENAQGYMPTQTLIEHWDGQRWNILPSADSSIYPQSHGSFLFSIVALSPQNAWAVGDIMTKEPGASLTLIEHWNGSTWSL